MKGLTSILVVIGALAALPPAFCKQEPELNVNSRYKVESVEVTGRRGTRLSEGLRVDLNKVVGQRLDHAVLDRLAARIKKELHVSSVTVKVSRGSLPEHVAVEFQVTKSHESDFELNMPKFLYHAKQGWSGMGEATVHAGGNDFTFGLLSDGDESIERFAGIQARFQRKQVGTQRLGLGFEFDSYHQQWNNATLTAAPPTDDFPGIYRSRQNFAPTATLVLAQPLTLSVGVSFERLQTQYPVARTESANAAVTTLRYQQRWKDSEETSQELDASYELRAATKTLESDFVYVRHTITVRYTFRHERSTVAIGFLGGGMNGRAPLFERFVLGNASTLRGWNKYDLDPLGGDRVAHGSLEYRYRIFQIFYDTGSVWDRGKDHEQKQSLGAGIRVEGFQLAFAFPIRSGRVEPVFYAGLNF